ncbi:hypothetical protein SRCM100623_00361 [Acetobacter pasteurianus]|uniref:PIN like domain-containing protein n=1 Tax=Acetobacter pasteurianus TaxID=438 RepID=A0A1A0DK93_ACEPA|nr:PIN domain-containing protein [Acetobacter pasteurianus]OAZ75688.1 hypothetical protein SRCM100623_00361 [Acetobacter pasteurianus]
MYTRKILYDIGGCVVKEKFSWYLNSSPEEADKNWSTATLTVDTNVLLDLYRYHNSTRDKILSAIESFSPRIWISNQACEEFFSNRKKVILDSEKIFKDASSKLSEIHTNLINEVAQLKGFRLIPRSVIDEFEKQISSLFHNTQNNIVDIKNSYPKYMIEDPILLRISNIFDRKVGNAFKEDEKRDLIEEGKRRFENKIPPGFKDDSKPDERGYGDFLLWSEVINYAKSESVPVILITSEQKEDWWEQKSGKTIGPRLELIKEFHDKSKQNIYIYQTLHFLELVAKKSGEEIAPSVVEEIKEVNRQRKRDLSDQAVNATQTIHDNCDCYYQSGVLSINLSRKLVLMTGSGSFEPEMNSVPHVKVVLLSKPEGCPPVHVAAGTGTNFDFNVHIRALTRNTHLPAGDYVVEYSAECSDEKSGAENKL